MFHDYKEEVLQDWETKGEVGSSIHYWLKSMAQGVDYGLTTASIASGAVHVGAAAQHTYKAVQIANMASKGLGGSYKYAATQAVKVAMIGIDYGVKKIIGCFEKAVLVGELSAAANATAPDGILTNDPNTPPKAAVNQKEERTQTLLTGTSPAQPQTPTVTVQSTMPTTPEKSYAPTGEGYWGYDYVKQANGQQRWQQVWRVGKPTKKRRVEPRPPEFKIAGVDMFTAHLEETLFSRYQKYSIFSNGLNTPIIPEVVADRAVGGAYTIYEK